MRTVRLPNLTGARFFAALAVLLMHLAPYFPPPIWLRPLIFAGGLGVVFFFVLSGQVLTWNYAHQLQDKLSLRTYFLHRVARIYPLYLLILLIFLGIALANGTETVWSAFKSWPVHALALQAWVPNLALQQSWNAPGWSVSSECFFYAMLPAIIAFRQRVSKRTLWMTSIVYSLCMPFAAYAASRLLHTVEPLTGPVWLVRLPLVGLIPFLWGVLSAPHLARRPTLPAWLTSPYLPLALLVWAIYCFDRFTVDHPYRADAVVLAVYGPILLWLSLALTWGRSWPVRLLDSRPLTLLGEASYALYLVHWLIMPVLPRLIDAVGNRGVAFVMVITGLVVLSIALHLLIERPARQCLTRRFGTSRCANATPQTPYRAQEIQP
jgi:peptidoglycan/LPS O-acetylase OafA/YrhL